MFVQWPHSDGKHLRKMKKKIDTGAPEAVNALLQVDVTAPAS